jgi:hypothetical protein
MSQPPVPCSCPSLASESATDEVPSSSPVVPPESVTDGEGLKQVVVAIAVAISAVAGYTRMLRPSIGWSTVRLAQRKRKSADADIVIQSGDMPECVTKRSVQGAECLHMQMDVCGGLTSCPCNRAGDTPPACFHAQR